MKSRARRRGRRGADPLPIRAGRYVVLALRIPGVVPHLALRPGHQLEGAAGAMAAFVHEILLRHDMAAVTGLRQLVDGASSDHPFDLGEPPARRFLGRGLGLLFLAAEPAMDLDPIPPGPVTGFAGDARDGLLLVVLQTRTVKRQPRHKLSDLMRRTPISRRFRSPRYCGAFHGRS